MIFYASPPMMIGKHEWRVTVIPSRFYDRKQAIMIPARSTLFEWRRPAYYFPGHHFEAGEWQSQRDWPRYNFNDSFLGLPRTLSKLYDRYKDEIHAALEFGQEAAP